MRNFGGYKDNNFGGYQDDVCGKGPGTYSWLLSVIAIVAFVIIRWT
jgi:hypothetical protein